MADMQEKTGS